MDELEFRTEVRKDIATILRITRESSKTITMAATHIVATSERLHTLNGHIDGLVEDAGRDSREVGIIETRMASKQERLLDIQIENAETDKIAKQAEVKARQRSTVKDYLTIFSLAVTVGLMILGFIKFYVKLP